MKKSKVFLGDLVHDWEKVSVWTMPLNIGFIASYAQKIIGPEVEFTLFKSPGAMINAIRQEKPDVIGLSYYVWNENINARICEIAKENCPETLTIGGGPHFTSLNINADGAREFFSKQPYCDAFVVNQGERGFVEVLRNFLDGRDLSRFKRSAIPGVITNLAKDGFHFGEPLDAIHDLDDIPSPYLNGKLDTFFNEPLIPMIETNRSCPYRCTFCSWGIGTNKPSRFSDQRILDELDYISQHRPKAVSLFFCDANYGLHDRDAVFARRAYENKIKYGFPGSVSCQWNKSQPQRVMKTVRAFGGLAPLGASCQTLHKPTLDAIKRVNLPLDKITEMAAELKRINPDYMMFSELILGLPLETRQTHIESNRKLLDTGVDIINNYNLHLLPGTEMATSESRQKYFKKTAYRLHDNCWGLYGGKKVFEAQEVVVETSTMSMADLRGFRFIHFLLQFMWSKKFYGDFLQIQREEKIHPVDFIIKIATACSSDNGDIGALYKRFTADHELESFASPEELFAYWSQDEQFQRLKSGDYGKLNYRYAFIVLLEHRPAFDALLYSLCEQLADDKAPAERTEYLSQCDDILRFNRACSIQFTNDHSLIDHRKEAFSYDILAWKSDGYKKPLRAANRRNERVVYDFYLLPDKKSHLKSLFKQFGSQNLNMTLRKMSEYAPPEKFFYDVRPAPLERTAGTLNTASK